MDEFDVTFFSLFFGHVCVLVASGKSTATSILADFGAIIINADKIGHDAFVIYSFLYL